MLTRGDVDYVEDELTAGRLYLELRAQLEQPGITTGQSTETKAALNKLERAWPEAGRVAAEASDDELGGLNAGLKRARDQHRRRRGVSSRDAANARARRRRAQEPRAGASSPPGARAGTPRRSSRQTPSSRRGGRRAIPGLRLGRSRAFEQTGIPGAGRSTSAFALQLLGLMIAMALLYLVLRDAGNARRGRSVIEQTLGTITMGLRSFIAPVDPLVRAGNASERRIATGEAAGPPAPVIPLAPIREQRRRLTRPPHAAGGGGSRPT